MKTEAYGNPRGTAEMTWGTVGRGKEGPAERMEIEIETEPDKRKKVSFSLKSDLKVERQSGGFVG